MTNLLDETLEIIQDNEKSTDEIKFVRCKWYKWVSGGTICYEYYMTWDYFVSQANKEYNNGYGGAEVKDDLQIVGKN